MKVNSVSQKSQANKLGFNASIVTLSKKNLGEQIATNIVDVFNKRILPEINLTRRDEAWSIIRDAGAKKNDIISNPDDFVNKINFFTLGAGSGSRFKELAQTVGNYNKASLPFKVDENTNIHMLDFAMTLGKHFIGEEGVRKIISTTPSGSFGDIVKHYMAGNPIKDTIVCCGDNVFGDSATDIMTFFTKAVNNPNKHIALLGALRTPKEVYKTFGMLDGIGSFKTGKLQLNGFIEKPNDIKIPEAFSINGKNIANTGMFYLSKESMEKLINMLKDVPDFIKKNDAEPYDFAKAVENIHAKLPSWFGINPRKGADIQIVKTWEDVGEPKAMYNFAMEVKNGKFLDNFPKNLAKKIQNAFKERVHIDDLKTPHIIFSDNTNITDDIIKTAKDVEGVKVIV